ncbi:MULTISPECIES: twin-arginine translocation signal domain-containing protein [Streptomyces]|uniref:twin-arginine translocation signal domain-containing protein n=1 Tax=Streptomyces TaxID=1883 RepID=UPI002F93F455
MPWTPPPGPSRRSLLAGAAATAGAALAGGCSGGSRPPVPPSGVALERRMRASAVRDSKRLLERYDATAAAHPALAGRLAPLRSAVAAHAGALAWPAAGAGGAPGKAAGAASGSAAPTGAPSPGGTPPAGGVQVPPEPDKALAALADAEQALAEARTAALAGAPGELARMLASVAACGAVHVHLLTPAPGAAS